MGSRKHFFSIEHEERKGQVATLNYEGVIRVLERSADPEPFRADYHVLRGAVPPDPKKRDEPARIGCGRGGNCSLCTMRPECSGGPPPSNSLSSRAAPESPPILSRVAPGVRTILIKRTVEIAMLSSGQRYLFDPTGDPRVRIPIFDSPAGDDVGKLGLSLTTYRKAARIKSQSLAFHLYLITSAPRTLPRDLQLTGKLIAVPVFLSKPAAGGKPAGGKPAARGKPASDLLAA